MLPSCNCFPTVFTLNQDSTAPRQRLPSSVYSFHSVWVITAAVFVFLLQALGKYLCRSTFSPTSLPPLPSLMTFTHLLRRASTRLSVSSLSDSSAKVHKHRQNHILDKRVTDLPPANVTNRNNYSDGCRCYKVCKKCNKKMASIYFLNSLNSWSLDYQSLTRLVLGEDGVHTRRVASLSQGPTLTHPCTHSHISHLWVASPNLTLLSISIHESQVSWSAALWVRRSKRKSRGEQAFSICASKY